MRLPLSLLILFIIYIIKKACCSYGRSEFHNNFCGSKTDEPWCIPQSYDLNIDPFQYSNESELPLPWNFTFNLWVNEVAQVDDKRQIISFLMYFRTQWYDPRIVVNLNSSEWKDTKNGLMKTSLLIPPTSSLWFPDLEIYGLNHFGTKSVFTDMGYLKLKPTKNLIISYYSDISITCQMDFTNFPLDEQSCEFLVTSYSKTNETVKCSSTLISGKDLNGYPQRSLQYEISWMEKSLKKVLTFPSGSWEYCGFRIHLDRISVKYLAGAYAPACLFVIISWLSFIIKPDAIPGRIMLLLNIFLMMIILMNDVKASAPDTNNINAMDMYLAVCTIHVFAAMIEYAVLLFLMKLYNFEWNKGPQKRTSGKLIENDTSKLLKIIPISSESSKAIEFKYLSRDKTPLFVKDWPTFLFYHMDWVSLLLFSLSFIIFNICYWSYFL